MLTHHRAATVREILESEFFPGHGKSGNFVDGQGNLESQGVSGNLKMNTRNYCNLQTIYTYSVQGERMYFLVR